LAVVLYRRAMMRIRGRRRRPPAPSFLVTGKTWGQVASQTVQNMAVIDAARGRIVLRPLVTYDKVRDHRLAPHRQPSKRQSSLSTIAARCSCLAPGHPARAQDAEKAGSQAGHGGRGRRRTQAALRVPSRADCRLY